MALDEKGSAVRDADPRNIVNPARIDVHHNSEILTEIQPRAALILSRRFGLHPVTAALIADANGFGPAPDRPDAWVSLGGAASAVVAGLEQRRDR